MRILCAGDDDFAHMLATVFAPVPHKERVRAMISVPPAIHLDIAGVVGELLFVFFAQHEGVPGFREQTIKELDIARVEFVIEFVIAGMLHDQDAAFLQQRFVAIKIEVITERHHLDQQRIENRIDVVGRDIGNP